MNASVIVDLTCVPKGPGVAPFSLASLQSHFPTMTVHGVDGGCGGGVSIPSTEVRRFISSISEHYEVCEMEEYELF